MPGIYIAALVATLAIAGVWGGLFSYMAKGHRRLAHLAIATLPLSAFVNLWVKRPLAAGVSGLTGVSPVLSVRSPLWFLLFALFLAPFTEEAIKLLPFAFVGWRRELRDRSSALWAGAFAGLGFGIGEVWYLAWGVARVPAYAGLRFWEFGGFIGERLLATYGHAILTAVAVTGLIAGLRRAAGAYLAAVGLHALLNSGAMLYQLHLVGVWGAQAGLLVSVIVLTLIFQRLHAGLHRGCPQVETTLFERPPRGEERPEDPPAGSVGP